MSTASGDQLAAMIASPAARMLLNALEQPVLIYAPRFDGEQLVELVVETCNRAAARHFGVARGQALTRSEDGSTGRTALWEAAAEAWKEGCAPAYSYDASRPSRPEDLPVRYEMNSFRSDDRLVQIAAARTGSDHLNQVETVLRTVLEAVEVGVVLLRPVLVDGVVEDVVPLWCNAASIDMWADLSLRVGASALECIGPDRSLIDLARQAWVEGTAAKVRRPGPELGARFTVATQQLRRAQDLLVEFTVDVSDQYELVERLQESEEQFHSTLASLRDAVILLQPQVDDLGEVADATVLYANPSAGRFFDIGGASAAQIAGARLTQFAMRSYGWNLVREMMTDATRDGASRRRFDNATGVFPRLLVRHAEFQMVADDRGRLIWFIQDRSDEVESQLDLARAEQFHEMALDVFPDPVFIGRLDADDELVVERVNSAASAFLPHAAPCRLQELSLRPENEEMVRSAMRQAIDSVESVTHTMALFIGFEVFDVRVVYSPLPGGRVFVMVLDPEAEVRASQEQLERSRRDATTGLLNRQGFDNSLFAPLAEGDRFALVLLQLEHAETVEQTLGHLVFNEMVQIAANRITASIDSRHLPARIGPGTFALAIPEPPSELELLDYAEQLVGQLSVEHTVGEFTLPMSASAGVAFRIEDDTDADVIVSRARTASFEARTAMVPAMNWRPEFVALQPRRIELLALVEQAIRKRELFVVHQPKVTVNGRLKGSEALVRWHHPTRGDISPGEFIPLVEQATLARRFTEYVMHSALDEWVASGLPGAVAVNIPPGLLADPSLLALVSDALAVSGALPEQLILEVTERGFLGRNRVIDNNCEILADLGVGLALDDFGTGSTSLGHLRRLKISELKIDREFVADVDSDPVKRAIVGAMVNVSQTLAIDVVAEGVERPEEAAVTSELGCTSMQGFLICRPALLSTWSGRVDANGIFN